MYDIHEAPPPFNPKFRPGFKEALEAAYSQYCENFPEADNKTRRAVHRVLVRQLRRDYPTVEEINMKKTDPNDTVET